MNRKHTLTALAAGLLMTVAFALGAVLPSQAQKPASAKNTHAIAKSSDKMRALFLTPGGLYTKADIRANGNQTANQKYGNFMASHDATPKPGQRVCPVTKTVANPTLTWVIGGKKYQFCCPPCITEFVAKAKKDPKSIKAPEAYVKK